VNRLAYIILTILITLWIAYFSILFAPSSDLQQMRRIILGGFVAAGSGVLFSVSLFKFLKRAQNSSRNNTICILLATLLMIASVTITFQMRLADSFRHAYASAFLAYYFGQEPATELGNLVEWMTSFKKNKLFSSGMDQCNNFSGRMMALDAKAQKISWWDVERQIEKSFETGELILSKYQHQDILACYKERFPEQKFIIDEMEKSVLETKSNG
jgi:hypothetical protein